MKKTILLAVIALLGFAATAMAQRMVDVYDKSGNLIFTAAIAQVDKLQVEHVNILGEWVDDFRKDMSWQTLTLNENNTGWFSTKEGDVDRFNYTFDGKRLSFVEGRSVDVEAGDVMAWYDPESGRLETFRFRPDFTYSKTVANGRWDCYVNKERDDLYLTYIFNGNEFELYIRAWRVRLKGTFTHTDGVLRLNITQGWNIDDTGVAFGGEDYIDLETMELINGYQWSETPEEALEMYKEELAERLFVIDSVNNVGYTSNFGLGYFAVKVK